MMVIAGASMDKRLSKETQTRGNDLAFVCARGRNISDVLFLSSLIKIM